jgi:hypothetical protein
MKRLIAGTLTAAVAMLAIAAPAAGASAGTVARCRTGHLAVSVRAEGAAAGTAYYALRFTNTGSAACSLAGWPGVSFVSAPAGMRVGLPAARDTTSPARPVTLAHGQAATATLRVAQARNYPASVCGPVHVHWLKVYPPGAYWAKGLPIDAWTCTERVRILYVTAVH